ncbi:hypothetical protein [Saccharopolyspora spinosa]|uniref:Uncharacterized protein n=1 Tax=Saccharopolyspora spinosa TaxID=60894 RepID=A0A2N3XYN1_SACSN|nr:hypothetical protein [Saccharopolyspora spinosa]PKW15752.1 hypothetical protein A8926_3505 [Saccharopolyspora spinosa]
MALEQSAEGRFVVLNDQPVEATGEDLLDATGTARALVDLITDSHSSTPFTVAIDAGRGMGKDMGKDSLMLLMQTQLEGRDTPTP